MPKFHVAYALVVVCLFVAAGCGKKTGPEGAKPGETSAPKAISDSFSVRKDSSGKIFLVLRRASLNKLFLFQGFNIPQPVAPLGTAIKSRVVVFEEHDGSLAMKESTAGQVVSDELPTSLPLALFPISSRNDQEIVFDFNAGMSAVLNASEWRGQDMGATEYKPGFTSDSLRLSYLQSAELTPQNHLVVRQVAQLERPPYLPMIPVEIKYFLSAYHPDPSFQPTVSTSFDRMGFFEVAARLRDDGSSVIRASKFNLKKPIVFAISSNTPPEYREAVRDGILYWNNALPGRPIQVVDAPAGVFAPDIDFNVVQWVRWDQAQSAYADDVMDPWTGEVMHAQVYLPSVFAFSEKMKARTILKRLREGKRNSRVSLGGLGAEPMCDFDASQALQSSLARLLSHHPDDATVLRTSQDYIREVVAHEIGHTLGLRHNFAGSLSPKQYSLDRRDTIFTAYLKTATVPRKIQPSSSVMDYLLLEEAAMLGNHIAKHDLILDYDRLAVSALYEGKHYAAGEVPVFCTDSHVSKFVDCQRFDTGSSAVEYTAWAVPQRLRDLPYEIIETYINAKSPPPGGKPIPVEEVGFTPEKLAEKILESRASLMGAFGSDKGFVKKQRQLRVIDELHKKDVQEAEFKYVVSEVERLGGMDKVFALGSHFDWDNTLRRLEKTLDEKYAGTDVAPSGDSYSFTPDEISTIKATSRALVTKLPSLIAKQDVEILGKVPGAWKAVGSPMGNMLLKLMVQRVEEYALAPSADAEIIEAEIEIPGEKKASKGEKPGAKSADEVAPPVKLAVKLPKFFYSSDIRAKAPALLASGSDEDAVGWGVPERADLKKRFDQLTQDALHYSLKDIKPGEVKVTPAERRKDVIRWLIENEKVRAAF